jgi:hypothetical protein
MSLRTACATMLLVTALPCAADIREIDPGAPLPRFSLVKEGTHRYLTYRKAAGANIPIAMMSRDLRFETKDGQQRMHIVHRVDTVGSSPMAETVDAWFEMGTFRPLSEIRTTDKDGSRKVEGFVFAADKVSGMPGLPDNVQKDFVLATGEPVFNFEMDNDLLQALPLGEGYEPSIRFYHPGAPQKPQRYLWKFVGSEAIQGPAGPVDCWVLSTDYNSKDWPVRTFWFAKGTQQLIRHQMVGKSGTVVTTLID